MIVKPATARAPLQRCPIDRSMPSRCAPPRSPAPTAAVALLSLALAATGSVGAASGSTAARSAQSATAAQASSGAEAETPPGAITTPGVLDEVAVTGERPGPRLWKITRGDHVLWLLGSLDHVPRKMKWHSTQVESALASSQVLLTSGPAVSAHVGPIMAVRLYAQWRGMQKDPDHTQLRDWLPAPMYARFEVLKARFDAHDGRIEELRPPFAALRLYRRALDAAGLTRTNEIEHSVVALAQRRNIPVQRPQLKVDDPLDTLKQVRALSPALEVDCLAATMQRLETDLPAMRERADAWAVGDVDRLRALPYPDQLEACITALSASPRVKLLVDDATRAWTESAESALRRNRVSFAVRPIYDLLAHDGPLARFRAEGYGIEGP
jgi:uncharacterized protein YbaP (TraB family)